MTNKPVMPSDGSEALSQRPNPGPSIKPPGEERAINGRREFQQAIHDALRRISAHDCRELWLCSADFSDWPLGERAVMAAWDAWAYSHRRCVVMACRFDAVAHQHPRWAAWRRQWSHIVDCRVLPPEIEAALCPGFLIAPSVVTVRLFDPQVHRGVWATNGGRHERECLALADALLQRSEPGFPPTVLGL